MVLVSVLAAPVCLKFAGMAEMRNRSKARLEMYNTADELVEEVLSADAERLIGGLVIRRGEMRAEASASWNEEVRARREEKSGRGETLFGCGLLEIRVMIYEGDRLMEEAQLYRTFVGGD